MRRPLDQQALLREKSNELRDFSQIKSDVQQPLSCGLGGEKQDEGVTLAVKSI
jgi:hypothetical protein